MSVYGVCMAGFLGGDKLDIRAYLPCDGVCEKAQDVAALL